MTEKTPTYNQILEQDANGYDPTVLVRRLDGKIGTTRVYDMPDDNTAVALSSSHGFETIERETLSDRTQALLARELAASALSIIPYEAAPEIPSAQEKQRDPRLAKIFQPLVRLEGSYESKISMSDWVNGNVTDEELALAREEEAKDPIAKAQKEYDSLVTRQSKLDAAITLRDVLYDDEGLKAILDARMEGSRMSEIVDAIREDEDLRYEVGSYLLDKLRKTINTPHYYPERIMDHNQKNPGSRVYLPVDNFSSTEYVAYLALAKIDGSFNKDLNASDSVVHNSDGRVTLGQHRTAADKLLKYDFVKKTSINFQ